MPPAHLLLIPANGNADCVHDLKGAPMGDRDILLDGLLRCVAR
jgi:hypothetical protein